MLATWYWLIGKDSDAGKNWGQQERGRQRIKWLDGITDSVSVSLSQHRKIMKDKEAWHAAVHGITRIGQDLATEQQQFSSVQLLSHVRLFATPWIAARHASLSITNSRSPLKLTSIESVIPSSHLILCHPLLLLFPIPPRIRVFSNESPLRLR